MAKKTLLENLRTNQAFDSLLKNSSEIEAVIQKHREDIIFTPDPVKRAKKIEKLRNDLINTFNNKTLSTAHDLGRSNARRIIKQIPEAKTVGENQHTRKLALQTLKAKGEIRSKIVESAVNAATSRLEHRLNKIWLEPADGGIKEKKQHLREKNVENEIKRKKYERAVVEFDKGERDSRPAKPKLDLMSELASDVKMDMREQARRGATDAELALYAREGYAQFVWVTTNGDKACPDCQVRSQAVGTMEYWESRGRPGSGRTICGLSCFCSLMPAEILDADPSIQAAPTVNTGGVLTTHSDRQSFNRRKDDGE